MTKRIATTEINHENWDDPEETEEKGEFKVATQDVLKSRTIRTAKRKLKPADSGSEGKSIFASVTFKAPPGPPSGTNKLFGFLNNPKPPPTSNGAALATIAPKVEVTPQDKYLANLRELNRSVSDWIKTHVDSDPMCILTPVFTDYEKHLKNLRADRDSAEKSGATSVSSASAGQMTFGLTDSKSPGGGNKFVLNIPTSSTDSNKTFSMPTVTKTESSEDKKTSLPAPSIFSLPKETGKSPLSQDSDSSKTPAPSIFSSFTGGSTGSSLHTKPDAASLMVNPFTSSVKPETKPFSFSNGATQPQTSSNKNDEEEEEESDEPPKVEFTPIQEEGSVFKTRCKVFVKKDNNFKDRGVGSLFIKKVGEDKHQLLVRAETVLGNILVNVLLSAAVPTKRMGKNNVMLVCLPTPQDPPPPTTVLLRVKTESDADDLLATIDKYKK